MKFSIIVPAYNAEKYIRPCLDSLLHQMPGDFKKEILLIDDCSKDGTLNILEKFQEKDPHAVILLKNKENLGLGLTRNVGLDRASGDWILFLDSDDRLTDNALKELASYIRACGDGLEVVGYNWSYDRNSDRISEKYGGRWDLRILSGKKAELLKCNLSMGIDSSVIYALVKKSLLDAYHFRFRQGIHEDIDFQFKVNYVAKKCGAVDLPLYLKNNRSGSLINSISETHLTSFFLSLKEIYLFLRSQRDFTEEFKKYYYQGILRVVATEVRYIWRDHAAEPQAAELYKLLYREYLDLIRFSGISTDAISSSFKPKYRMIADHFLALMSNEPSALAGNMAHYLKNIQPKSWSCSDLQASAFLTPDEIRTCCKRFFVDNLIKGDVVLLDGDRYPYGEYTPENILKEKRGLHVRTNTGLTDECVGCPYLQFKNWEPINVLHLEYLSLEYSTVCNMRCLYCSDKFFGGVKPGYDVERLLALLFQKGCLRSCQTIVWGGGEPVLDKSFTKLISFMAEHFPDIKQRVFTNATLYSETLDHLLKKDNILVITSIDAGNEENFYQIRKHRGLKQVLENLSRYAMSRPENMIIKYIITEQNGSLEELRSFVSLIHEYGLKKCNFQISINFKKEFVDLDALISAIALHLYLTDINVRFVFFDDLFWQRISDEMSLHREEILNRLKTLGLSRAFVDQNKYQKIVIWGAGIQAKFFMDKSLFFKKVQVAHLVDNSTEKIGKYFFGHQVLEPQVLLSSQYPILVAAVQNTPVILKNYFALGISESRLIKGLVI